MIGEKKFIFLFDTWECLSENPELIDAWTIDQIMLHHPNPFHIHL